MVAHVGNLSTWEAEVDSEETEGSLGYIKKTLSQKYKNYDWIIKKYTECICKYYNHILAG